MRGISTVAPLAALLATGPFIPPATAVLTSEDDPVFGMDAITADSDTGLEWLDVTLSSFRSYEDLIGVDGSNEFGPSGDFAGFRYATNAEAETFLVHAGLDTEVGDFSAPNFAPAQSLLALIGVTIQLPAISGAAAWAISGESSFAGTRDRFVVAVDLDDGLGFGELNGALTDGGAGEWGSWLVREAPEPASAVVAALAALGLLGLSWRGSGAHRLNSSTRRA